MFGLLQSYFNCEKKVKKITENLTMNSDTAEISFKCTTFRGPGSGCLVRGLNKPIVYHSFGVGQVFTIQSRLEETPQKRREISSSQFQNTWHYMPPHITLTEKGSSYVSLSFFPPPNSPPMFQGLGGSINGCGIDW